MPFHRTIEVLQAAPTVAHNVRHWIYHLGGLGFIPLGLLDSSVVPLPGSMDLLTIVLAARDAHLWIYYALMATAGSVIGAYFTYRLARKGGKDAFERRFGPRRMRKFNAIFEKWGAISLVVPAVLPPPIPMVPFLVAAGAMQYPVKKFLAALTAGRIVRYTLLAFVAARYGQRVSGAMMRYVRPALWGVIIAAVAATIATVIYFLSHRKPG